MILTGKIVNMTGNEDKKRIEFDLEIRDKDGKLLITMPVRTRFKDTMEETREICRKNIDQMLRDIHGRLEREKNRPPVDISHIEGLENKELEFDSVTQLTEWKV